MLRRLSRSPPAELEKIRRDEVAQHTHANCPTSLREVGQFIGIPLFGFRGSAAVVIAAAIVIVVIAAEDALDEIADRGLSEARTVLDGAGIARVVLVGTRVERVVLKDVEQRPVPLRGVVVFVVITCGDFEVVAAAQSLELDSFLVRWQRVKDPRPQSLQRGNGARIAERGGINRITQ